MMTSLLGNERGPRPLPLPPLQTITSLSMIHLPEPWHIPPTPIISPHSAYSSEYTTAPGSAGVTAEPPIFLFGPTDPFCRPRSVPDDLVVNTNFRRNSVHLMKPVGRHFSLGGDGDLDLSPVEDDRNRPQDSSDLNGLSPGDESSIAGSPPALNVTGATIATQSRECALVGKNDSFCPRGQAPEHARKCISQFFGRNKTETRQIPAHAWVWVCRKHYQRGNYHNKPDFWKTQSQMLFAQLDRFEHVLGTQLLWEIKPQNKLKTAVDEERRYLVEKSKPPESRSLSLPTRRPTNDVAMQKAVDWTILNQHFYASRVSTEAVRNFIRWAIVDVEREVLLRLPDVEFLALNVKPSHGTWRQ